MYPIDPVNVLPLSPLQDSYTYHSQPFASTSTSPDREGWIMGIDEAGRGPVLGPMVYAAAYCPLSFKSTLEEMGFDDSKALSAEVRQALWESFDQNPPLCYSSTTLSPQSISLNMLRRAPVNLNRQAEEATIGLIQGALDRNIHITECFVDALGPAPQWQARLSVLFPTITFTVCPKADSLFKIVSAASIIAKVTRDRYLHHWSQALTGLPAPDPKTQAYLKDNIDPVFGYKGIVRFSWATVKVLLDKQGVECKWIDDVDQPSAKNYFSSGSDNGRPKIFRDLGISGVGEL
ncbi:ribonuclease H2 subunit A, partial [Tremellales sp. Uapishka_1]